MRRVQAVGGAIGTTMQTTAGRATRRVREIASKLRTWGKLAREETSRAIRRVTGELADLADKAAAEENRDLGMACKTKAKSPPRMTVEPEARL